jgi:hypothetical protein
MRSGFWSRHSPDEENWSAARTVPQINMDVPTIHHDALEFPDGQVVLLTRLCAGQHATVLQLPATAHPAVVKEAVRPEVRERSRLT